MIIECITVVLCVLIICISICYCNKPNFSSKKVMNIDNILLHINQSLSEIKENSYYIDRKLEIFKGYLMENQSENNNG